MPPSSLDHWAPAHYVISDYSLRSRKHRLWYCVKYEHAHCWKRFALCFSRLRDSCSNSGSIAIQGLGAGMITSSVHIVLSDLVTLRERGTFSGLMALSVTSLYFLVRNLLIPCSSWALGGGVGPVIGGSLAQSGNWYVPCCQFYFRSFSVRLVFLHRRWLFCMCNLISNVIIIVNN